MRPVSHVRSDSSVTRGAPPPRVLVLMATHNGQAYLNQQLKSILSQRGVEVVCRASDAGSTDSTYRILETFAQDYPGRIEPRYDATGAGRSASLLELVYTAEADEYDYFALADQKDIWHPDKLRMAARRIAGNTSRPELYYANVREIDERGKTIGLPKDARGDCAAHPLSLLLVPDWAPGCTMVMNRALVKLLRAHPLREVGRSSQTWIHAVALCCGGFVFPDTDLRPVSRRVLPGSSDSTPTETPAQRTQMAAAILRAYGDELLDETARLLADVVHRGESAAARLRLCRSKELVAPTAAQTRVLRRALLLNRL